MREGFEQQPKIIIKHKWWELIIHAVRCWCVTRIKNLSVRKKSGNSGRLDEAVA